ncbi:putative transposase OrfB [Piscirickettsia salmonis]|uniref:IS3 family transposase n=1 Tax=Piscirickettsia salmonis TaxID=1238 RepID=UPI001E5D5772|nr:IS3 family transposase [Piscirickettsia salmonis]QGP50323.1 putative transposase OrfB [Piscirickettsia salmonis]
MTKVLRREGMRVNRKKVKRLMNLMGLKAIFPGPKTSLKGENHKIYDYLLDGLHIVRPNQVWQVDITYIRTRKGFAYLYGLNRCLQSLYCRLGAVQYHGGEFLFRSS